MNLLKELPYMKSIKPGRGPSKLSAIGYTAAAVFGVMWCIIAGSMGAGMMIPFGVFFIIFAICGAVYSYKNATSDNRYSIVDIVDESEESDPLNQKYGKKHSSNQTPDKKRGTALPSVPIAALRWNRPSTSALPAETDSPTDFTLPCAF
jgi:hypothetical protein